MSIPPLAHDLTGPDIRDPVASANHAESLGRPIVRDPTR